MRRGREGGRGGRVRRAGEGRGGRVRRGGREGGRKGGEREREEREREREREAGMTWLPHGLSALSTSAGLFYGKKKF